MISLREHPHIQGLLLGTTLVFASAAAAPYALSVMSHAGDAPESPVTVVTDSASEAGETTTTTAPPVPDAGTELARVDTEADGPSLASP